ncbi:unnamed protein product [marine sediment metagenome]|uniref:Uncharacterized protein n=1 Tax=marine sediment metagenome TaxID=412755 RepID=X1QC48_9ZZZZ
MALRWNKAQTEIYGLIQDGASNKDLKAKGYKKSLVDKVKAAISKDDVPQKLPSEPKTPSAGEPLFSATLKTKKVTLEPIVAVRYDSVRHALELGNDYTLEQFIDESTDIITELVGAVPPGFVKEEPEKTKEKEVAVV